MVRHAASTSGLRNRDLRVIGWLSRAFCMANVLTMSDEWQIRFERGTTLVLGSGQTFSIPLIIG
jgi:hypothetical protein